MSNSGWMLYDCSSGDLLEGPFAESRRRQLYEEITRMLNEPQPNEPVDIALCEASSYERIKEGYRRRMSGNPPRDLRRPVGLASR